MRIGEYYVDSLVTLLSHLLYSEEEPLKKLNWCRICTLQNKQALIASRGCRCHPAKAAH